jgi:carboxymethylenebutenolidase
VKGASAGDIEIEASSGGLPAYRAVPASGRGNGVLVIHEADGLGEHVRDVCDRLAREGFVALAPDLLRGRRAGTPDEAVRLASALSPEAVAGDLECATSALLGDSAVEGARLGAVGFCLGGHLALLAATRSPRIGAVADFYGVSTGAPLPLEKLMGAVLGVFAEHDEYVSDESVQALREALEAAGVRASIRIQRGAGHGFMNDTRPERFDARAAQEGWQLLLAFLRAELA